MAGNGIGGSWGSREELLHPRDKRGRFRKVWKMAEGAINAITNFLDKFQPRTFQSDGQAAQYAFNRAKPSRFGGGSLYPRLHADLDEANEHLRSGDIDEPTKKFVQMMDSSSITTTEPLILSHTMNADAFGLTPETLGQEQGGLEDLTGWVVQDPGYSANVIGTPMGHGPGKVTMTIAVPRGTKAIIPARSQNDRMVFLDRDQEYAITKVEPDGRGGYYMMAVAVPKTGRAPTEPMSPGPRGAGLTPQQREERVKGIQRLQAKRQGIRSDAQINAEEIQRGTQQGLKDQPAQLPPAQGAPQQPAAPGEPPPRTEPILKESVGGVDGEGKSTAEIAQATPEPPPAPEAPAAPVRNFREAAKEAGLDVPSAGKRRVAWNRAYGALTAGRRDPGDVLRELDADIRDFKHLREDNVRTGNEDSTLDSDIGSLEQLADTISKEYGVERKAPEPKKAAPREMSNLERGTADLQERIARGEVRITPRRELPGEAGTRPVTNIKAFKAQKQRDIAEREERKRRLLTRSPEAPPPVPAKKAPAKKATVTKLKEVRAAKAGVPKTVGPATVRGKTHATALNVGDRIMVETDSEGNIVPEMVRGDGTMVTVRKVNPDGTLDITYEDGKTATTVKNTGPGAQMPRYRTATPTEEKRATKKAAPAAPTTPETEAFPETTPGSGKVRMSQLRSGVPILVEQGPDGKWRPATKKTGATKITVQEVNPVTGRGGQRQVVGVDDQGNRVQVESRANVQTFFLGNAPAKKAAPKVPSGPSSAAEILARLNERDANDVPILTRDQASEMVNPLRKAQLLEIAKEYNIPSVSRKTVPELKTAVVEASVGRRRDSIAIRGFTGRRPGEGGISADEALGQKLTDKEILAKAQADLVELQKPGVNPMLANRARLQGSGAANRIEAAKPKPTDRLDYARWRVAKADIGRDLSKSFGALDAVVTNQGSRRAVESTVQSNGWPLRPEVNGELRRAGLTGDVDELHKVIDRLAKQHGLVRTTKWAEEVDAFDPKKHEPIGDLKTPPEGSPVRIVRPGFAMDIDGEQVLLERAVVDDSVPEVGPDNAPTAKEALGAIPAKKAAPRVPSGAPSPMEVPEGNRIAVRGGGFVDTRTGELHGAERAAAPPAEPNAPAAQKPIQAPDRREAFAEAWTTDPKLVRPPTAKETAAHRSAVEVRDDVLSGKLTPDEGIRRLETDIDFNKQDLAEIEADLRGDLDPKVRARLVEKREKLREGISFQENASSLMRKHFRNAPAATPDEIKVQVAPEVAKAIDEATPEQIREDAKIAGYGDIKGDTKEEILQNTIKKIIEKQRSEPAKAAKKLTPAPLVTKKSGDPDYVDARAIAEGLDMDATDERMLKWIQERLDGTGKYGEKPITPAAAGRLVEKWANGPSGPAYASAVITGVNSDNMTPELQAEHDQLRRQFDRWMALAERLKKTRRRPARKATEPAPEKPKLTPEEKKVTAQAAEILDVPKEQLQRRALAKKVAAAPASEGAKSALQTLKTLDSRQTGDSFLRKRTKSELQDIAKASGMPYASRDTKDTLINRLVEREIGGRLEGEALRNVGVGGKPEPSGPAVKGVTPLRTEDVFPGQIKEVHEQGPADLANMSPAELADLENELGIKRTSLDRGDRIAAIRARQADQQRGASMTRSLPASGRKWNWETIQEDNMTMHGDSASMNLAQKLRKAGREEDAQYVADMRYRISNTQGEHSPDDVEKMVSDLKRMMDAEQDPALKGAYRRALDDIEAPQTPAPKLPESTPPTLRRLMDELNQIPVARRSGHFAGTTKKTSAVDRLAELIQKIESGNGGSIGTVQTELRSILRSFHESVDGAFQMWRLEDLIDAPDIKTWIRSFY